MSYLSASSRLWALSIGLVLVAAGSAAADEFTGMSKDDPKDFIPPSLAATESVSTDSPSGFEPLPHWAREASMPPLPQTLRPMGNKVAVLTTPPVAARDPLVPPKEDANRAEAHPRVLTPMPPIPPAPSPDLVAISPFLQWVKSNPQAAAEQARQQASAYPGVLPGLTPGVAANPNTITAPGEVQRNARIAPNPSAPATANSANGEVPYWLPPLIDSPDFGSRSTATTSDGPAPVTGSSAIYSTPQR